MEGGEQQLGENKEKGSVAVVMRDATRGGEKTMRQIAADCISAGEGFFFFSFFFFFFHIAARSGLCEKDIDLLSMISVCQDSGMIINEVRVMRHTL